jgi:hypothetical protein
MMYPNRKDRATKNNLYSEGINVLYRSQEKLKVAGNE